MGRGSGADAVAVQQFVNVRSAIGAFIDHDLVHRPRSHRSGSTGTGQSARRGNTCASIDCAESKEMGPRTAAGSEFRR